MTIWVLMLVTWVLFLVYSNIHIWYFKWWSTDERWGYSIGFGVVGTLLLPLIFGTLIPATAMAKPNEVRTFSSDVVAVKITDVGTGVDDFQAVQKVRWQTENGTWHKGVLNAANDSDGYANVRLVPTDKDTSSVTKQVWFSHHPLWWPWYSTTAFRDTYVLHVGKDLR